VIGDTGLAQSSSEGIGALYLPEYTASGSCPAENFHEWVYVGSPASTPNALMAVRPFPQFHNVYIEAGL